ncbi:MAG TPA: hypothetical protein VMG31_03980 [Verrucomicrobiae bacterium]|nr:hypothetical protein [Verrucomicrobiae bacterium]
MQDTRQTKFIAAIMLAGVTATAFSSYASHRLHPYLALAILGFAVITSRLKVKLPGINGNMSVNLPFLLTAVMNLSGAEAVGITVVSTAVQCWPKNGKMNRRQMEFNLSMMAFAAGVASLVYHFSLMRLGVPMTAGAALSAAALFLSQTGSVAGIVSLSEGKSATSTWRSIAELSFPYYVVSAGISVMVQTVSNRLGWELALAVFPVMYLIHRSYRLYFSKWVEAPRTPVLVRAAGAGV